MSYQKLLSPSNQNDQNIQVCSISFNKADRIRFIGLPMDVIDSLRIAIRNNRFPIKKESAYHSALEFKLRGFPWLGISNDAVDSRRLLASILKSMAEFGWNLVQAVNVSKKNNDKDTLFFEKGMSDPDVELFAMSLNMYDRIRIIDAPSLADCVKDAIKRHWPYGIKNERTYFGSIEFQLKGSPWRGYGPEAVYGRRLLCQIIANLRAKGFKLYASVDISPAGETHSTLDSWIFRRVGLAWY